VGVTVGTDLVYDASWRRKARKREVKEGKPVLFPVRLVGFEMLRDWECFDGDTGKDSAREIRGLAPTEDQVQMLETLPMWSNVQPQLQPHLGKPLTSIANVLLSTPHSCSRSLNTGS
jgi:hypothetical protein